MADDAVLVTKRDDLQIALDVGNGPAIQITFLSNMYDASDPSEPRVRTIDTDSGVALAIQILRAFHPSLLAEHEPLDLDALFDSPEAQEAMRKANDIMKDMPFDESASDSLVYTRESQQAVLGSGSLDEMFKPGPIVFVPDETPRATAVVAVCWETSPCNAQLDNGRIIPITNFLDSAGVECDREHAEVFVAGSDEQGWFTDVVANFVDLKETMRELTATLASVMTAEFVARDGRIPTEEEKAIMYAAFRTLQKYDQRLSNRVLLNSISPPKLLTIEAAFEEIPDEEFADAAGVRLEDPKKSRGSAHSFVEMVYREDGTNTPAQHSAPLGRGFDVVSPQPKVHGAWDLDREITLDEAAKLG